MELTVIAGPNFSGRTAYLRRWVGLGDDVGSDPTQCGNAYVGPDPVDGLSGLAPTVAAEFELAAADPDIARLVRAAACDLGFEKLLPRNPFTLSGGEQVVIAILAAAAGRPPRLAIDSALEQLADATRSALLEWLADQDGQLMLADNRLNEWYDGPRHELSAPPDAPRLRPELSGPDGATPVEIEIRGLSYTYPRGAQVFRNFDLKLEAGVTYRLSGPNGAGKTTLSKILCGLIKPDCGEISIDRRPAQPWRAPGTFVSYHFQNPSLQLFSTSVAQQLSASNNVEAAARRYGLEEKLRDHPLDLPFALRKRVGLAASASRSHGFLILDEPTVSQDDFSCGALRQMLDGGTGFRISHSRVYSELPQIELG